MNKHILSALFLSLVPATLFVYSQEEHFDFRMVPGNYLKMKAYTSFEQKVKKWKWQPNDHFNLIKYYKHRPCGDMPDHYDQIWLFQAIKSGQTELVFTHKKKKKIFRINILRPIPNPNQTTPQYGMFDSHQ